MGDEITQLQKALEELQGAVVGLSSRESLSGVHKQAVSPYPAPGVGAPADDRRVPAPPGPRSDEEAGGLTKALEKFSESNTAVLKAVNALLAKQDEEEKKREEIAKARLGRVRKLREIRNQAKEKTEDKKELEKMIESAVAKALGKPEDEEMEKQGKEKEEDSPYPAAKKMRKQAAGAGVGPHAEEKGEGDELSRAELSAMGKAYEEEEVEKQEDEEDEVEKAVAAALGKQPEEDEEMEKQEDEIPEDLKKLLESRGFSLSGDFNPSSQVEKARLLKSMGYRPMPVTQGLPYEPRSAGRGDGSTLGDVVDKVKGMTWSQINQFRTKVGAW
jgi:hypothetical protein